MSGFDESLHAAARQVASKAWLALEPNPSTPTHSPIEVVDVILRAVEPVFRDGYLSLASEKLEALASTVLAYNDYLEGRKDGVCESATVVSLLKGGQ